MMESQMNELEAAIYKEFREEDKEKKNYISVRDCEVALHRCKALNITPY